ncbi:unnamed protein product [Pylaiella littoralis]
MQLAWHPAVIFPALMLPLALTQAQTCSNGIEGIDGNGVVCCALGCGTCGGPDCSTAGGLGKSSCCGGTIKDSGILCSESGSAPCIIDAGVLETEACSGGIEGIDGNGVVCCPLGCGQCGGSNCAVSGKSNGLGSDSCCGGSIKASGVVCSESGTAPCVYEVVVAPTDSTCSNGIAGIDGNGVVCCPIGCGTCGGSSCATAGRANGLGSDSCCGGGIKDSGVLCSVSGVAPCIIDGDVAPTPAAPSPAPVEAPVAAPVEAPSPAPVAAPVATPTPAVSPSSATALSPTPSYLITSPTPIMTTSDTCTDGLPPFRYAASTGLVGKGRLYAEGAGCFTPTDLYNFRGVEKDGSSKGPLYVMDDNGEKVVAPTTITNKWLLEAELYVEGGAVFYCKGTDVGGDCDEFRIRSNGADDYYEVRGHGGSLYFENTIVTSWNTTTNSPQETYEGGRSFVNCVSEREHEGDPCDGQAKNDMGECRMDLINSEVAYLGWFDSESYGITWKVRGFCKDLSNHDVFTRTNVYGDIRGCNIHHNYYGHYSYGHQGGVWTDNKMHDNHQYGFDPHDDSDYLTISNNEVYGNVNHGIIASKRCNNVTISNNEVRDGGAQAAGIFLHRSTDNAQVFGNTIFNMQDAGIALLESMNANIYDNSIGGTGGGVKYGIRMSLGSAGNYVHDNTFDSCTDFGLYTYMGSDAPDVSDDGRPEKNLFEANTISNTEGGVKLKRSDSIVIFNNEFTGTVDLEFFDAQDTTWLGNTLPDGVCIDNISSDDGISISTSTFINSEGLPTLEC